MNHELLTLFRLKFNNELPFEDKSFNIDFLMNCYERFFSQVVSISLICDFNSKYKKVKKQNGLSFKLEKTDSGYSFKFYFTRYKKIIYSLESIYDENLYQIEEYYSRKFDSKLSYNVREVHSDFRSFDNFSINFFKVDFTIKSIYENEDLKRIPKYKSFKVLGAEYPINEYNEIFHKYYVYEKQYFDGTIEIKIKNIRYLNTLENSYIAITYNLEENEYFSESLIKKHNGKLNISNTVIEYLKETNKTIEDLTKDNIEMILLINY